MSELKREAATKGAYHTPRMGGRNPSECSSSRMSGIRPASPASSHQNTRYGASKIPSTPRREKPSRVVTTPRSSPTASSARPSSVPPHTDAYSRKEDAGSRASPRVGRTQKASPSRKGQSGRSELSFKGSLPSAGGRKGSPALEGRTVSIAYSKPRKQTQRGDNGFALNLSTEPDGYQQSIPLTDNGSRPKNSYQRDAYNSFPDDAYGLTFDALPTNEDIFLPPLPSSHSQRERYPYYVQISEQKQRGPAGQGGGSAGKYRSGGSVEYTGKFLVPTISSLLKSRNPIYVQHTVLGDSSNDDGSGEFYDKDTKILWNPNQTAYAESVCSARSLDYVRDRGASRHSYKEGDDINRRNDGSSSQWGGILRRDNKAAVKDDKRNSIDSLKRGRERESTPRYLPPRSEYVDNSSQVGEGREGANLQSSEAYYGKSNAGTPRNHPATESRGMTRDPANRFTYQNQFEEDSNRSTKRGGKVRDFQTEGSPDGKDLLDNLGFSLPSSPLRQALAATERTNTVNSFADLEEAASRQHARTQHTKVYKLIPRELWSDKIPYNVIGGRENSSAAKKPASTAQYPYTSALPAKEENKRLRKLLLMNDKAKRKAKMMSKELAKDRTDFIVPINIIQGQIPRDTRYMTPLQGEQSIGAPKCTDGENVPWRTSRQQVDLNWEGPELCSHLDGAAGMVGKRELKEQRAGKLKSHPLKTRFSPSHCIPMDDHSVSDDSYSTGDSDMNLSTIISQDEFEHPNDKKKRLECINIIINQKSNEGARQGDEDGVSQHSLGAEQQEYFEPVFDTIDKAEEEDDREAEVCPPPEVGEDAGEAPLPSLTHGGTTTSKLSEFGEASTNATALPQKRLDPDFMHPPELPCQDKSNETAEPLQNLSSESNAASSQKGGLESTEKGKPTSNALPDSAKRKKKVKEGSYSASLNSADTTSKSRTSQRESKVVAKEKATPTASSKGKELQTKRGTKTEVDKHSESPPKLLKAQEHGKAKGRASPTTAEPCRPQASVDSYESAHPQQAPYNMGSVARLVPIHLPVGFKTTFCTNASSAQRRLRAWNPTPSCSCCFPTLSGSQKTARAFHCFKVVNDKTGNNGSAFTYPLFPDKSPSSKPFSGEMTSNGISPTVAKSWNASDFGTARAGHGMVYGKYNNGYAVIANSSHGLERVVENCEDERICNRGGSITGLVYPLTNTPVGKLSPPNGKRDDPQLIVPSLAEGSAIPAQDSNLNDGNPLMYTFREAGMREEREEIPTRKDQRQKSEVMVGISDDRNNAQIQQSPARITSSDVPPVSTGNSPYYTSSIPRGEISRSNPLECKNSFQDISATHLVHPSSCRGVSQMHFHDTHSDRICHFQPRQPDYHASLPRLDKVYSGHSKRPSSNIRSTEVHIPNYLEVFTYPVPLEDTALKTGLDDQFNAPQSCQAEITQSSKEAPNFQGEPPVESFLPGGPCCCRLVSNSNNNFGVTHHHDRLVLPCEQIPGKGRKLALGCKDFDEIARRLNLR